MEVNQNKTGNNHITVFLGSSNVFNYGSNPTNSKAKELKKIVTSIEEGFNDVKVKPWWEYPTGDETILERVTDNIYSSDFCVFVLARDVETTEKVKNVGRIKKNNKRTERLSIPNINVLLELGIAISKGKRVLLLNWDPKHIILPSDYNGKFYTPIVIKNKRVLLQNIIDSFKEVYNNFIDDRNSNTVLTKYKNINIYYNKDLATTLNDPQLPKNWGTKALFLGAKSSSCWADIENNDKYPETSIIKNFLTQRKMAWENDKQIDSVKDIVIDNIVSFGPGAGTIDDDLVRYFQRGTYLPFYIPIDISVSLVTRAIEKLSKNACFPIPFAIVDDFEEGPCFERLEKLIKSKEYEIHKRNLFSIVGVTFSNYSKAEHYFLDGIWRIMQPNEDYLLMDVIADNIQNEQLVKTVNKQIRGIYKDLIVHSIRKRFDNSLRNKLDSFLIDNVNVHILDENAYAMLTNVEDTRIVECSFEYNDHRRSLLIIKHYNYRKFKNYLKEKFNVLASTYDETNMRGLFLLSKKTNPNY